MPRALTDKFAFPSGDANLAIGAAIPPVSGPGTSCKLEGIGIE